jgi:hypothetical protein
MDQTTKIWSNQEPKHWETQMQNKDQRSEKLHLSIIGGK